ncbi:MAG TPA: NFACT RNA binding domain-containing protein [Longimicrobiales bacterium]|nr:NFACT RNA binding domain-containing protein [Longimicrobiales bacterium]
MSTGAGSGWRSYQVDGFEIIVGRGARDNDALTFGAAEPHDLWLHAAAFAGSHVIVRNPERLAALPRAVVVRAAELAAWHSKAQGAGGKVEVHVCRAADVSKPRGAPPGQVRIRNFEAVRVYPRPGD